MYVLYHDNCCDGFTAAWLYWRKYPNATFIPVRYGEPLPYLEPGKSVVIVDFSYPRHILLQLKATNPDLLVLDHHKTAAKELEGLDFCRFDMEKSGARLAAEELKLTHWLVDYTEDRDLWLWKLPYSRTINAALQETGKSFTVWSKLDINKCHTDGEVLLAAQAKRVAHYVSVAQPVLFEGHDVRIVNATSDVSEIGEALAPFGLCYNVTTTQVKVSLRSTTVDVSEIASRFGGGGHRAAAGFTVPLNVWAEGVKFRGLLKLPYKVS